MDVDKDWRGHSFKFCFSYQLEEMGLSWVGENEFQSNAQSVGDENQDGDGEAEPIF